MKVTLPSFTIKPYVQEMEDQEGHWEVRECEESRCKASWLTLGKRVLVTGFVISSAPLVLPPLVIASALGFACSVPYGLFLASYACTEKLMSKLLPCPSPSPQSMEGGTKDYGNELRIEDEYGGFGGELDMEKEEEKEMEDAKGMVEMGLEIADKENVYALGGDRKELLEGKKEIWEENGYEVDVGQLKMVGIGEEVVEQPMGRDMVGPLCGVAITIEGDERSLDNFGEGGAPLEVTSEGVELYTGNDKQENEELVQETRELIEKMRDGGIADKEQISMENVHGGAERGTHVGDRNGNGNITEVSQSPNEKKSEETGNEVAALKRPEVEATRKVVNGADASAFTEMQPTKKRRSSEEEETNTVLQDEKKSAGNKAATFPEDSSVNDIFNVVKYDFHPSIKKEAMTLADEDARDIGDDKDAAHAESSNAENGISNGSKQSTYLEDESKGNEILSGEGTYATSKKVSSGEEKFWMQIDALRIVVGYTTMRHAACLEELKALYLFTGVEPPTWFKDPSDLVEVDDKLRFLMSITGVK